jgi:hypothetical protein
LHAGDLVNHAESDAEWGEWFGAGGWLNAMTPLIAIPGNHEHVKVDGVRRNLSKHWRKVFSFPTNGPVGLEETCYTLTYHNLRVIALNSTSMHQEQAQWLEGVLAANKCRWVVCTFHHPLYSTAKKKSDNVALRKLWKPIFDKYKVDLVLQGHDHSYGRTVLQTENQATGVQVIDKEAGTVYVVSVSGPKMYENSKYQFMKRIAEDTQLYQVIHIDGDKLSFEARTAIGDLYDAFELHKQVGKVNRLVELEPAVPENFRGPPTTTGSEGTK